MYDIETSHLSTASTGAEDTELLINTFLEDNNVHPVCLQQFMKDMVFYHDSNL